jgi:serine/threonine protein kinase
MATILYGFEEKYEKIGDPIGKGNDTLVYIGKEKGTNKLIAIKIINLKEIKSRLRDTNTYSDDYEDQFNIIINNFKKEFEIMRLCSENNENSVKCYECFRNDEYFSFIMELCETNLKNFLETYSSISNNRGFDERFIYQIMSQLNKAFKKMREKNVVHGDLKLENILIKYSNGNFIVKLCDFGMSKILPNFNSNNYSNSNRGTLLYNAPELLASQKHNYKIDLWSIGIILYRLYFIKFPFLGETEQAILSSINIKLRNLLNENKRTNDEALNDLIKSLLERDIKKRLNWDNYFNHRFFQKNYNTNLNTINNYIFSLYTYDNEKLSKISGILYLFFLKSISDKIDNVQRIANKDIRNIVVRLQRLDTLNENSNEVKSLKGLNIMAYAKYVSLKIEKKEIYSLISLLNSEQRKKVIEFWIKLYKFNQLNKFFEEKFLFEQKQSYFEYSLSEISFNMNVNFENFVQNLNNCENCVSKCLFHGTRKEIVSKIIKEGFLYSKRAYIGMGIYFTNMLDYVIFYCGGNSFGTKRENWGKIIPVGKTFSCVGTLVYYNENKKKEIHDSEFLEEEKGNSEFLTYDQIKRNYPTKMIEKNGVHTSKIELVTGKILNSDEIEENERRKNILGADYVVTEKEQILPLYGLTLKRNEFLVIWKDSLYGKDKDRTNALEIIKFKICENMNINVYFENTIKKALELIKIKRFNKIILISDLGQNIKEKDFINDARRIMGFPIMVLFYGTKIISNFPNALYTQDANFCLRYIRNYNNNGLRDLKREVENNLNIRLNFTRDFLSFNNFIDSGNYNRVYSDNLYIEEVKEEEEKEENKVVFKNK